LSGFQKKAGDTKL
jgi:acyl-CoA-binding protein